MKNDCVIWNYTVVDIDTIVFCKPAVVEKDTSETFIYSHNNIEYESIKIGDYIWITENSKFLYHCNKITHNT